MTELKCSQKKIEEFKKTVWAFYMSAGRMFAWRKTKDPYKILVSEVMLQQTQVARVAEKYPAFIKAFPTIHALAEAPFSHVFTFWQGMGYNRRALALHRLAREIVAHHHGRIPRTRTELESLPGIGAYTAGAILTFAFNEPEVFIETNIRRVFIHHFFAKEDVVSDTPIKQLVEKTLDCEQPREWYFALMDYGAHIPKTSTNPNRKSKHYVKQKSFVGSHRQIRGKVLAFISRKGKCTADSCTPMFGDDLSYTHSVLSELVREGFIQKAGKYYMLLEQ